MPFNGSGAFSAPAASFPAVTGTVIDSSKYNAVINDLASGLTTVITKDGQTTVTANLPMATYRHTGVGNALALTDYASASQIVTNDLSHASTSASGVDAYVVSLPLPPPAYAAKQRYQFIADVDNAGDCSVNFSGIGAASIKLADGSDPLDGQIQADSVVDVVHDGTNFILINPSYADNLTCAVINQGANNVLDDSDLGSTVQAYDAATTKNDASNTFTGNNTFTGSVTLRQGVDVASATALTLGDGNAFDITGTTTITSIATKGVGAQVTLQFDGILTLTHHATDLVLPNGNDITTAAGDILVFYEYATGDWRLIATNKGMLGSNNLSDVASAATSRTNLGLGSLALLSSVTQTEIAAGLNQQTLFAVVGDFTSVTASGWNTIYAMSIYVPSSATSLAYVGWLRNATSGQDNSLRIVAAVAGTTAGVNGLTYAQTTEGTLDVSASSGWLTINIQLNREGGTETFIRSMSTRFI